MIKEFIYALIFSTCYFPELSTASNAKVNDNCIEMPVDLQGPLRKPKICEVPEILGNSDCFVHKIEKYRSYDYKVPKSCLVTLVCSTQGAVMRTVVPPHFKSSILCVQNDACYPVLPTNKRERCKQKIINTPYCQTSLVPYESSDINMVGYLCLFRMRCLDRYDRKMREGEKVIFDPRVGSLVVCFSRNWCVSI